MSETPWYVEHSKEPKGEYGGSSFTPNAAGNPENRRGVSLQHHTDYGSTKLQRALADGLAILREAPNRVVMVGGDIEPGGDQQEYQHIRWDADEQTYKMVREWSRTRTNYEEPSNVLAALDETFNDDSFVCVLLIYQKNSPFNVPERPKRHIALAA